MLEMLWCSTGSVKYLEKMQQIQGQDKIFLAMKINPNLCKMPVNNSIVYYSYSPAGTFELRTGSDSYFICSASQTSILLPVLQWGNLTPVFHIQPRVCGILYSSLINLITLHSDFGVYWRFIEYCINTLELWMWFELIPVSVNPNICIYCELWDTWCGCWLWFSDWSYMNRRLFPKLQFDSFSEVTLGYVF